MALSTKMPSTSSLIQILLLILTNFHFTVSRNDLDLDGANTLQPSFCHQAPPNALLTSCKEIKKKWPNSLSGYYTIGGKRGPVYVYCHMEELCGSGGGWTRLSYLDMSDFTESCPSGFKLYQSNGIRACGRAAMTGGGCTSVKFPSHGVSYSQVCGRAVGLSVWIN